MTKLEKWPKKKVDKHRSNCGTLQIKESYDCYSQISSLSLPLLNQSNSHSPLVIVVHFDSDKLIGLYRTMACRKGALREEGKIRNDAAAEAELGDALLFTTMCIVGMAVDVHAKDGSVFSGIFHTASVDKDYGSFLSMPSFYSEGIFQYFFRRNRRLAFCRGRILALLILD